MKKITLALFLICMPGMLLCACNKETYSYEEITGYSVYEIEVMETNGGYLQSFRVPVDISKAALFDIEYKETEKDIYSLTLGYDEKNELPLWYGGMIYVHMKDVKFDFVLDNEGYVYLYSPILQKSFVSVSKLERLFFARA